MLAQECWELGTTPIFTIEMILGATSCNNQGEMDCAFAHYQDQAIIEEYLKRVEAAAAQVAGGGPVIFHIEPDAVAYMQRYSIEHAGEGGIAADDPASLPAANHAAGYPPTFAGWMQRLVDRIHAAAPNALVSVHARMWATGMDVGGNTNPDLDVASIARRTASFLSAAGGAKAELFFVDWKTADAGSGASPWWDESNQTFPNFNRALFWANQVSAAAQKPLILWRVPAGNPTLDNTCDHYQDTRIDYAFHHTQDIFNAGIIGVVIGGGSDCRTDPSTDGGNILHKASVVYAPPAAPAGLKATLASADLRLVEVSWAPNSEFDVWGYWVYLGRSSQTLERTADSGRQTSLELALPEGGDWLISVSAYDSRGNHSPLAAPLLITAPGTTPAPSPTPPPARRAVHLPLVQR